MQDLGAGVSSEITDAACAAVGGCGKIFCMQLVTRKGCFLEVVILAIETVKGTRMIKHGQILIPVFRTVQIRITWIPTTCPCRTDKIGHAIGRKWIIVIGKLPFVGPPAPQLSSLNMPHTTKACRTFGYPTPMETQGTGTPAFITGSFRGESVGPAAPGMNRGNLRPDFREMTTDAICTEPNDIRDRLSRFFAISASSHCGIVGCGLN